MEYKSILICFAVMFGMMMSVGIVLYILTPNNWTEMVEQEMENCTTCMNESGLSFENNSQNEIVTTCESCHWCYWNDTVWDPATPAVCSHRIGANLITNLRWYSRRRRGGAHHDNGRGHMCINYNY